MRIVAAIKGDINHRTFQIRHQHARRALHAQSANIRQRRCRKDAAELAQEVVIGKGRQASQLRQAYAIRQTTFDLQQHARPTLIHGYKLAPDAIVGEFCFFATVSRWRGKPFMQAAQEGVLALVRREIQIV